MPETDARGFVLVLVFVLGWMYVPGLKLGRGLGLRRRLDFSFDSDFDELDFRFDLRVVFRNSTKKN